jgi:hypothetical protein
LPEVPKKELLSLTIPGVYGVKEIEIHEDYVEKDVDGKNDLAILTLAKPFMFDNETKKGELQTKSYHTKGKVESN